MIFTRSKYEYLEFVCIYHQTIDNGANNYGIAFDNISLINNSSACNPDYDFGDAPDNEDLQKWLSVPANMQHYLQMIVSVM
ncbi:hypothetical protein ACP5PY_24505 [Photobacterium leiognathi subsp. mandapamensis]